MAIYVQQHVIRHVTFTIRPFESTIQILLAASSLDTPSLAMAIISRWAIPIAAWSDNSHNKVHSVTKSSFNAIFKCIIV